jgi:hypothetical protein
MLIVGYVCYKHRHGIETGLTYLLIFGAITLGISVMLGVGMGLYYRSRRLRAHRPSRPLNTKQDIPVLSYRLNPEPVAEVEAPKVTFNGLTIDDYAKIKGKRF